MRHLLLLLLATVLAPATGRALEVNEATRAQLEQLSGLGVVRVERILRERERAPFQSWDDLQARVKGIGRAGAEKLGAQGLTVNGSAPQVKRKP
ncbi:MAG: ComEA family DNA-binding protein [Gemmatimonadota bacterium]